MSMPEEIVEGAKREIASGAEGERDKISDFAYYYLSQRVDALANKIDVLRDSLDNKINDLRQEMKQGDEALRREFKVELSGLRQEFKEEIGSLRQEIGGVRLWAIATFLAVLVGAAGVVITLWK